MSIDIKESLEYAVSLAGGGSHFELPDGGKGVLLPDGMKVEKIPPLEQPLPRVRQAVTLFDAASFIAYVNRFKTEHSRIFAMPGFIEKDSGGSGQAIVTAVLDYHKDAEKADYLAHKAIYKPRYSTEWDVWKRDQTFEQVAFAKFIEENRKDIRSPEAAQLLDIIRTFKATKSVEFDSLVYQPNGSLKISYTETTKQNSRHGETTDMPEVMTLGIPVYFRDTNYEVDIFVRYRVDSGRIEFRLKPDRLDVIENHAFTVLCSEIGKAVEIEPYLGRVGG